MTERDRQFELKFARIIDLEFQVKELQRLICGSKRERFVSEQSASQLSLSLDADEGEVAQAVEAEIEKITYERQKPAKPHPGRTELPSHVPVVETIMEPAEDVSQMRCIGQNNTDELELQPASMFIKRTRRPKYAAAEAADGSVRIIVAPMHKRPIGKCMAGVELLTTIVTDKHVHHLPIDRQLKRYSMLGVDIPPTKVES